MIQDGSRGNFVGGTTEQERNYISGNRGANVLILGGQTTDNHVIGNFIGTDLTGEVSLTHGEGFEGGQGVGAGIQIMGSSGNFIGGPSPGERNLIAAGSDDSPAVSVRTNNNVVQNNFVGTNWTGDKVIILGEGSQDLINIAGTDNKILDNLISGAFAGPGGGRSAGLLLVGNENVVQGNRIGTDITGQKALGNDVGIQILGENNTIGGPGPGQGNTISGNDRVGILIKFDEAKNNKILGNHIGTNPEGTAPVPNLEEGVFVGQADSNQIGGLGPGEGNLISGNGRDGIEIENASQNLIYGNRIGTDASGLVCLDQQAACREGMGNKGFGIIINGGGNNVIGVNLAGQGAANTIAFNSLHGIRVIEGDQNTFRQNRIYKNTKGGIGMNAGTNGSPIQPAVDNATVERVAGNLFRLVAKGFIWTSATTVKTLDFYASPTCGPDGVNYLGSTTPPLDPAKKFAQSDFRSSFAVEPGDGITATATDPDGNTSTFSNCVVAVSDDDGDGSPNTIDPEPENNRTAATRGGYILKSEAGQILGIRSEGRLDTSPVGINILERIDFRLGPESNGVSTTHMSPTGGDSFQVTVELPPGVNPTSYFNFGPTPEDPNTHWYEFLFDGATGAEILEEQIILHFVDGERGDHDLMVNGEITTLGGPSLLADLHFPFYQADGETFVGFAVSNFSEELANLQFQAFEPDGAPLEGLNPAAFQLGADGQLAKLGNEIFELPGTASQFGWVLLDTDNREVGSFFQFGGAGRLDGSVALPRSSSQSYFTRIFSGPSAFRGEAASTLLTIANPNLEEVEIELTLVQNSESDGIETNGLPENTPTRMIPAKGFLSETVASLFGEEAVSQGYVFVQVTSGAGVVGFELVELAGGGTVIGLNAAVATGGIESFSAQLASASNVFTNVNLINTTDQHRGLSLEAISEDGSLLASAAVDLDAGEVFSQDMTEIFGLDNAAYDGTAPQGSDVIQASLRVQASGEGVIGDIIFGDPLGVTNAAALPLQTQTFTEAVFNQVANGLGLFTGLAFYNPEPESAQILIQVFSPEGDLVGEETLELPAGQRLARLVPQLVPDSDGQIGGYIRVSSDQPLIAQQLFGTLTLSLLSAVPPTIIR